MNTKTLGWFLVLAILVIGGFYLYNDAREDVMELETENDALKVEQVEQNENEKDVSMMMKDTEVSKDEMMMDVDGDMMEMDYTYSGVLRDVTGGVDVRGINTAGVSAGLARAEYKDEHYKLLVTFENLPDPVGDDFYEGWIVRKGANFDVISSGVLKKVGGGYVNTYASGMDLTDHDFYVLTLEPNDGDPAPADHILEGTLTK